MAIDTLLPKKLDKTDDSYKSVEELDKVLSYAKEQSIRNIALTGPFGSGKSSVLTTLMSKSENYNNHIFLNISLATLQENDEKIINEDTPSDDSQNSDNQKNDNQKNKRKEQYLDEQIEKLNRKIEYSILQQIIYREKSETVPNSRFKRITHLSKKELIKKSLFGILTFICYLILFEPSLLRIDTISNLFNLGITWNTIFDFLSSVWLLYVLFKSIRYIIQSYSNSKLNKLNLKDGTIDINNEECSIFNKHLDEILYFFQATDYNVVIIEDLDRFNTTDIFLKLRELNQLINESKIVDRHITFIYAVKDDIFKDEERTKFFDYIISVIPIINPSNSKDKLKSALESNGCGNDGISDEDLSEMAFFIQDMRILTNIVNEYKQYRDVLCANNNSKLNKTKLLAMIVYKNYHPKDFALLHRRQGNVYNCINSKKLFINEALKDIEAQNKEIAKKEDDFLNTSHIKTTELRLLLLYKWKETINPQFSSIYIDNSYYSLEQISSNDELFEKLLSMQSIQYRTHNGYYHTQTQYTNSIELFIQNNGFKERLELLTLDNNYFESEYKRIIKEKTRIKSLRIKDLIKQYNLGKCDIYKNLKLSDMQDVFIRLGYIDEEYYDYISYFYPEMISSEDRDLLLSIKRQIEKPYDTHIDKIDNFVKELKDYMFESDAILNNDLLDYLAKEESQRNKFEMFMQRIECKSMPLEFLVQYYIYGNMQEIVFKHLIKWNNSKTWNKILNWNDKTNKTTLIEAYLKFCSNITPEIQIWLNNNYKFITNHIENISLDKSLKLASNSSFIELCDNSDDLLDYVIEFNCYQISLNNLFVITKQLCKGITTLSLENLNYTRIKKTNNNNFIKHIDNNISLAITEFQDINKDESSENIIYILNHPNISNDIKLNYLNGQQNHIDNFNKINDTTLYDIAIETLIIAPTWQNVSFYYQYKGLCDLLIKYIYHYTNILSNDQCSDYITNKSDLYNSLFGTNLLDIKSYQKLLNCFNNVEINLCQLASLETERLIILINANKLQFNQDTISIMNKTQAFAEYIIHHSKQFINNLNLNYEFNTDSIYKIISSNAFSLDEKYNIIGIIPPDILKNSHKSADVVINIYIKKQQINISNETLSYLLKNVTTKENKILLVTTLIENGYTDHNNITKLLSSIGNEYEEICNKSRRAKLHNNKLNSSLLNALENIKFISSSKEDDKDKNFLRVYHKSQHK